MKMGLTIEIGIGVGLATVVVGIFNIVRGRRIFRKKTAQQKLGFAFGSVGLPKAPQIGRASCRERVCR